ncbi:hypothetical protein KFU94_61695 [Chloroflexi bacterium TSY]|nr:hypothetical protein [Chloroflexi bacterium TSY]
MTLWRFIPLADYIKDLAFDPEPDKGLLRHVWEHYFSRTKSTEENEVEFVSPDLQSAPARLLDWVVPPPNWLEASDPIAKRSTKNGVGTSIFYRTELSPDPGEIDDLSTSDMVHRQLSLALEAWQGTHPREPGIQMLLTAPHSGVDEMVRGWAQRQGYLLPVAPTNEQICAPSALWLDELKQQLPTDLEREEDQSKLVIVGLEKYYLRHHNGLGLIRRLMDYLTTEGPPSLVVCHSWAWAYLHDALHVDAMVRPPLTLERCSGEALGAWLIELSSGSHHRTFTFRRGKTILFTVGAEPPDEANEKVYQTFFDKLADISRGNPGIARALWRHSITIEASVDVHEQVQREAADDPGYTIWVQPIDETILPVVPSTFTNDDAFILQTLLIHNGLPRTLLQDVLPRSTSFILRRLQVMLNAELVQYRDGLIEVSPLGYLAVRAFLREQGFFVDDL